VISSLACRSKWTPKKESVRRSIIESSFVWEYTTIGITRSRIPQIGFMASGLADYLLKISRIF
jgi:hypothetical protein